MEIIIIINQIIRIIRIIIIIDLVIDEDQAI
jgi:hypothetical protein